MPHHSKGGRPKGAIDIPLQLKGAVIAMRLFFRLEYQEIEAKTGVGLFTIHQIYHKAMEDAGNEDFYDMLYSLSDQKPRGRHSKVENRSQFSNQIQQDILKWGEYKMEEATAPALVNAGISLAKSTIEKIAHEYQDRLCEKPIV